MKYALKNTIEIGDEWLFEIVIPNIRKYFRNDTSLCHVLALPLLYACLKEDIMVPEGIRTRVKVAFSKLGCEEVQPVTKIPLHVYRIDDKLMIDPIGGEMGAVLGNGPMANPMTNLEKSMMVRFNRQDQQMSI